jgi:Flp pilus assembly protein TadD
MWSRASTDGAGRTPHASTLCRAIGGTARGRSVLESAVMLAITTMLLAGCESAPTVSQPAGAAASASGQSGSTAPSAGGAPNIAPVPVTPRGKADFDRAVGFMRAGNTTEAELEFKQVALQFPQLSAPYVNLGILYRKTGRLDQSEEALKTAVERNDGSAVAWTELGATQRLRGEFPNAAASYEKAIAADPNFAPAYRNLGVVSDLYLGDPERALTAFERYKELTGEEKPVSGWIAELRQRTGKPPLKRPSAAPASGSSDAAPGAPPPGSSAAAPGTSDAPGAAAPGGTTPGAAAPGAATPATPQAVPGASQSGKPAEPRGGQPPAASAPSPQAGD